MKKIIGLVLLGALVLTGCSSDEHLSEEAQRGKTIFVGAGECANCHDTSSGTRLLGPSLKGLAQTKDAAFFKESILNPNKDVTEGFSSNLMPQDFRQRFNDQQIGDLVAYLLTLK